MQSRAALHCRPHHPACSLSVLRSMRYKNRRNMLSYLPAHADLRRRNGIRTDDIDLGRDLALEQIRPLADRDQLEAADDAKLWDRRKRVWQLSSCHSTDRDLAVR